MFIGLYESCGRCMCGIFSSAAGAGAVVVTCVCVYALRVPSYRTCSYTICCESYAEGTGGDHFRRPVCYLQAVWEGRQKLPADYWKEFARGPYLIIVGEVPLVVGEG